VPHPRDPDAELNVGMAAERTWLAWWRTSLVATAGALGVGRLAPTLLHAAPGWYMALGCIYALLALGLLGVGLRRQQAITRAIARGETAPVTTGIAAVFTVGGIVLTLTTAVVVLAQL
jgi:putative membrane protein